MTSITPKGSAAKRGRISKARPAKALRIDYRGLNEYRFSRETIPEHTTFTLIAAGASQPAMGYLNFDNLSVSLLPGWSDFSNLFARYKVDKVETFLTPLFDNVNSEAPPPTVSLGVEVSPQLYITRVNTKWLNEPLTIQSTSGAQQEQLAQFQCKTRTLYSANKPLVITTMNPRSYGFANENTSVSGASMVLMNEPGKWYNTTDSADANICHNSVLFAERIDGQDLTTAWKYEVRHRIHFRCSQVG